jgi:hypothetical protein
VTCTPWPIRWTCDTPFEDVEPELRDIAISGAQDILWNLSGRRYGICEVEEAYRPPCDQCLPPHADTFGPGVELALGREKRDCCKIHLDSQPVRQILRVEVNGEILDPSEYALDMNVLRRVGRCWPCGDGCDEPPVVVLYEWGMDVPALGELAMGEVACEILKALQGKDCRLPNNAVSVTRQGVSVQLGDSAKLFEQMRLGLPVTDMFLMAVNPYRLPARSKVFTPDFARRAR